MIFEFATALLLIIVLWRLELMAGDFQAEIARLQQDIQDLVVVEDAAIALIENLALQIRSNMNDPVALDAIATSLEAQKDRLAAAVAANTPADVPSSAPADSGATDGSTDVPVDPTTGLDAE